MNYSHGGNIYAAARACGFHPADILDFSASINPLGMPPRFKEMLASLESEILNYPDPESSAFVSALADYHQLPERYFLAGNGSAEFIYLLPEIMRPKSVLITAPAFSEYERSYQRQKGIVSYFFAREQDGFALSEKDLMRELKRGYSTVYIANPSTPAGALTSVKGMRAIITCAARHNTTVIADEAFIDFCEEHSCKALVREFDNLYVLRSMTKFFGIPGLRCGCLISDPRNLEHIRERQQPWSLSAPAQLAGIEALRDAVYIQKTRRYVAEAKQALIAELKKIQFFKIFPGSANFILIKLGAAAPVSVAEMADGLLRRGILVRPCANFKGLEGCYFRIAVKKKNENKKFIKEVKKIFAC